jgi:hypothetical protein
VRVLSRMRIKASIISFLFTLLAGLAIGSSTRLVEWYWPSFTYDEAVSKLNQRVRYHRSAQLEFFKCPEDGVCRRMADGEVGTVVAIE